MLKSDENFMSTLRHPLVHTWKSLSICQLWIWLGGQLPIRLMSASQTLTSVNKPPNNHEREKSDIVRWTRPSEIWIPCANKLWPFDETNVCIYNLEEVLTYDTIVKRYSSDKLQCYDKCSTTNFVTVERHFLQNDHTKTQNGTSELVDSSHTQEGSPIDS